MEAVVVPADGDANAYLARIGVCAIVVRPDRHILGVAKTADELDRVLKNMPILLKPSASRRVVANI